MSTRRLNNQISNLANRSSVPKNGSIGVLLSNFEAKIVDSEGNLVSPGEVRLKEHISFIFIASPIGIVWGNFDSRPNNNERVSWEPRGNCAND